MQKVYFLFSIVQLTLVSLCYAQNTIEATLVHGGLTRSYRIYVPATYSAATPVPLVLNLHGYSSNNIQQEFYGDFRAIADTANFIIVHPNGTQDGSGNQFWNAIWPSGIDDVGFLSTLIDVIQSQYAIDPNSIYSTGMSNGGFMSYELACQLSNRIAAIASVTGSMVESRWNSCNAAHPTPVMQIHGTADATVAYNGVPAQSMIHIDTLVKRWATFNNCDLNPVITPVPNTNLTDGCTAEHQVFGNGDLGSTVELFKVIGGAHTWPGAAFTIAVTSQDFSASVEIWRFFRRYKLNNLSTAIVESAIPNAFELFPNPSTGNCTLRFSDYSNRTIVVTNSLGQEVIRFNTNGSIVPINITEPGFYVIAAQNDNKERSVIRAVVY